jgi:hypothetical protein
MVCDHVAFGGSDQWLEFLIVCFDKVVYCSACMQSGCMILHIPGSYIGKAFAGVFFAQVKNGLPGFGNFPFAGRQAKLFGLEVKCFANGIFNGLKRYVQTAGNLIVSNDSWCVVRVNHGLPPLLSVACWACGLR